MIENFANVANNWWSRWLRDKRDSWLNIINYQSCYWQKSSMFIRYDNDFDDATLLRAYQDWSFNQFAVNTSEFSV